MFFFGKMWSFKFCCCGLNFRFRMTWIGHLGFKTKIDLGLYNLTRWSKFAFLWLLAYRFCWCFWMILPSYAWKIKIVKYTPWKINMEPTNHPFRKENDLPKPPWWCSMLIFRGVDYNRSYPVTNHCVFRIPDLSMDFVTEMRHLHHRHNPHSPCPCTWFLGETNRKDSLNTII